MTDGPYIVFRTYPARAERPCGGKHCATVIGQGEPVSLVVHEWRWIRDPEARDAQAELCGECAGRLGDRARAAVLPERATDHGPHVYRGKPVPSW